MNKPIIIPPEIDIEDLSQHAHDDPRQMAYEVSRRVFLLERGTVVRRSKHNKIKTDSFKE